MTTRAASPRLVDLLKPGDRVLVGSASGEPQGLIEALIEASSIVSNLTVIQVANRGPEKLADAAGPNLRLISPVPGPRTRVAIDEGRAELLPRRMSELANMIETDELGITVVLMQGRLVSQSLATPGLAADLVIPAWRRARVRGLELNSALPRVPASDVIAIDEADFVMHSHVPPAVTVAPDMSERALTIGRLVAGIVPDGATIEIGIGRALAGIGQGLVESGRSGLGVHTGVLNPMIQRLIEAGTVNRAVRNGAFAVGATANGDEAFLEWADENSKILLAPSTIAHDVANLCAQSDFTAINSAIEVDLDGNVNLTAHGGRTISGPGGGPDFCEAGARSYASVVCLFSTTRSGSSMIVPSVAQATMDHSYLTHLVTEHGVASLRGLSDAQRRAAIIAVAAPQHRAELSGRQMRLKV